MHTLFLSSIYCVTQFLCLGVLSAGLASTYPTSFTYAAQYVQLTGNIAGNLSLGASLGSMILPALAGKMMETSPKDSCSSRIFIVDVHFSQEKRRCKECYFVQILNWSWVEILIMKEVTILLLIVLSWTSGLLWMFFLQKTVFLVNRTSSFKW